MPFIKELSIISHQLLWVCRKYWFTEQHLISIARRGKRDSTQLPAFWPTQVSVSGSLLTKHHWWSSWLTSIIVQSQLHDSILISSVRDNLNFLTSVCDTRGWHNVLGSSWQLYTVKTNQLYNIKTSENICIVGLGAHILLCDLNYARHLIVSKTQMSTHTLESYHSMMSDTEKQIDLDSS